MSIRFPITISLLLFIAIKCDANFAHGDFVPTSRKAQFGGKRTQWHDVLGAHCPKFGINRMVALPIPQPVGYTPKDDYKIQLSFDGDRIVTPWLLIMGKRAPATPYLEIELVRSGDALIAAYASVEYMHSDNIDHLRVRREFSNDTHWPKHLPIKYVWRARHEVDVDRGLTVLFALGAIAMVIAALRGAHVYRRQIRQFIEDVTAENVVHYQTPSSVVATPSMSTTSSIPAAAAVATPSSSVYYPSPSLPPYASTASIGYSTPPPPPTAYTSSMRQWSGNGAKND